MMRPPFDIGILSGGGSNPAQTWLVAYQDSTNSDAKFGKSGNNGSSWAKSTIESTGSVGSYCSIDRIDSTTFIISYMGASNVLSFAKTTDGGANWTVTVVDATTSALAEHTCIHAVDANTYYIGYFAYGANGRARYAKTTNGGSSWTTGLVDSVSTDVGRELSLFAISSTNVIMSYWDGAVSPTALRFAVTTNGGTNWTTSDVERNAGGTGRYSSIYAITATTYIIIYRDPTGPSVKQAKSTNSGGSWTITTLETNGVGTGFGNSLYAIDQNNLILSYYGGGTLGLRFGKSTNGGTNWTLSTVDASIGTAGQSSIVAYDSNTYGIVYTDSSNNLKFALTTNGGTNWTISTIQTASPNSQTPALDNLIGLDRVTR